MTRTIAISPTVADVLQRSTTDGLLLFLPPKLDRKLYADVNKVLAAIGGAWDKRAQAHVFTVTAKDAVATALGVGTVTPPSKNGYFPTPPALVAQLIELSEIAPDHWALEPSAGQGAIADQIRPMVEPSALYLVEILPENVAILREKGYRAIFEGDFLDCAPAGLFDRVVMNPPFEKQADIDHVRHAWAHLRPGGRLVSVMAAGVTFRGDRKAQEFRDFLDAFGGSVEHNPDGSFRESGTDVSTITVVINKPGVAS